MTKPVNGKGIPKQQALKRGVDFRNILTDFIPVHSIYIIHNIQDVLPIFRHFIRLTNKY